MDDPAMVWAFESCEYPYSEWNHRAHVRIGYLYVARYGLDEAVTRMRVGLQAYNREHGVIDGLEMGYHETITQAFVRLIDGAIRRSGVCADSEAFCERHPELLDKGVLLRFYSRDRIVSRDAKSRYVEPDLAKLDDVAALANRRRAKEEPRPD